MNDSPSVAARPLAIVVVGLLPVLLLVRASRK
jgi:hypothetical protein